MVAIMIDPRLILNLHKAVFDIPVKPVIHFLPTLPNALHFLFRLSIQNNIRRNSHIIRRQYKFYLNIYLKILLESWLILNGCLGSNRHGNKNHLREYRANRAIHRRGKDHIPFLCHVRFFRIHNTIICNLFRNRCEHPLFAILAGNFTRRFNPQNNFKYWLNDPYFLFAYLALSSCGFWHFHLIYP